MPLALFGITNDALNLVVNLLILFLVVLWLALVAWTYFDARRRIAGPGSGRLRDRRVAVSLPRDDRLLDPAPAGVHRRQARARARNAGLGAARAPARGGLVPELRAPDRAQLSCAARTAVPASRTRASRAASRSTRAGRSARTARRRCAAPRRPRSAAPQAPLQGGRPRAAQSRRPPASLDASVLLVARRGRRR